MKPQSLLLDPRSLRLPAEGRPEEEVMAKERRGGSAAAAHGSSPRPSFLLLAFYVLLCLSCFQCVSCQVRQGLEKELDTLKVIGAKLKANWNYSVHPCETVEGWGKPDEVNDTIAFSVSCTCRPTSNTTSVCRITNVVLKGQNYSGALPEEFADLTSVSILDLTRNYFSGLIPAKWATLPLIQLSLVGNQISGGIPKELGSIKTLQYLTLQNNLLQYPIPDELGKLTNLNRLLLTGNNLNGSLPESFGNLKNLTDFRIDGNPISGKIPAFIGNWTKLTRLDMQGTSLDGPFPPTFSKLTSIEELRVSDWKGGDGKFPAVDDMANMKELVLRNLSISGVIPDSLAQMKNLRVLDLSFNNLSGRIPDSFSGLKKLKFMYLSSNNLSGSIPDWIKISTRNFDISYNSFTGNAPTVCGPGNVNMVSSFSTENNSNSINSCLRRNLPCSGKAKNYKLFINCGGGAVVIDGNTYEADVTTQGPSNYEEYDRKWAYSSTGDFVGNEEESYIANNISVLTMKNSELYTDARLNPLSLKYYGLCLQKGQYSVKLHFAEIMFIDNKTFASNGRRLFDVSIQNQKVLRDFNVAKEANGTGKELIKNFTATVGADGTLEIHFQWAGKGTNSIPQGSVYGPLVSAISVTSNFKPDLGEKLSTGAIVGIVLGACVVVVIILAVILLYFKKKNPQDDELRGLELHTGTFSLRQIKAATRNFDPSNKIGEGGFGPVYKGVLPDGSVIAVKQLSSKSKQGNREFVNEIGMISALQHPNLVKLYGCCIEGSQLLLVYEYMENNSLARALFGPEGYRLNLDWATRRMICIGIARGLAYLHEESRLKIVHRDIKATNVLLDKNLNAKISDFGLAKLDDEENTHISTRIAGTIGYMAPEYAMRGYLTDKADVYSFGVVTLEIVSGVSNTNYRPKEDFVYLLDWAYVLQEQGSLLELVDKSLGPHYSKEEALQMLNLALVCTNPSPTLRPMMSTVVSMLEDKTSVKVPPLDREASKAAAAEELRFKAFQKLSHDSQTQSISMEEPWNDSSVSTSSSRLMSDVNKA